MGDIKVSFANASFRLCCLSCTHKSVLVVRCLIARLMMDVKHHCDVVGHQAVNIHPSIQLLEEVTFINSLDAPFSRFPTSCMTSCRPQHRAIVSHRSFLASNPMRPRLLTPNQYIHLIPPSSWLCLCQVASYLQAPGTRFSTIHHQLRKS